MSRPIRVLNVAEKPSVAKSISAILSGNNCSSRAAHSQYNRVFEFLYTRSRNGQHYEMLVTSVTGHLMELDFTDQYRKWNSCDPVTLYEAPVRKFVPQDKLNIKKTLEQEARQCQMLVLWLDCDLEGENIAFEVIEVCRGVNPRLDVKRAHFSDLTERRITAAWNDLKLPDQRKTDAVDVRQEIDLRIGASFTRFQTMLLKDKFVINATGDDRNLVLSYGPCQFPTLGFIVERYWEIQAHEPEEFWVINCSHTSEEGTSTFNWMRGHMFDYTCAVMIYEMCVEEPTATVTTIREQERSKYPPHPLNTIELEKRASRYFRMSSEHTMKVAEELYQSGFISYPRTETDAFPENTDLQEIVHQQQQHPDWGFYAQRLLDPETGLWSNPSRGGHDDKAHPPIHPTKFSAGETTWTENHRKVYELVVRHFLACVSKPAKGAETTVEIDISGESFSVSGRVILERNYLDVYRFESWGASTIPKYVFGQQFIPTRLTLDSGVTRPPSLLSEADLLSCMDKEKIGTDATMHDHIKKLLDRFYATKDTSTRFSPTNLGEALVMGYDDMGYELWKPYLRSQMEADMKKVEAGQKRKDEVLINCLNQMKDCFVDARRNRTKLSDAMAIFFERSNQPGGDELPGVVGIVRRCGTCNESDMALKRRPDGHFMVGCLGYPQCRNVVWLPGPISEATVTAQPCNTCSTAAGPVFRIQFKFRHLEIPQGYDVNHLGCIGGCDDTLRELIQMCGTGPRVARTAPAAMGRGRGTPSGNNAPQQRQNVPQPQSAPPPRKRARAGGAETDGSMACTTCGEPCQLCTANTDANRGRKFYSCQSRECNFFVWEDENHNGAPGRGGTGRGNRGRGGSESAGAGRRGGRGRGGRRGANNNTATGGMFVSATGEAISNRCYTCGDPSHFANVCPNRHS